ncbi:MAG: hypothetical protein EZS28_025715, partial [Streblomastix strix]
MTKMILKQNPQQVIARHLNLKILESDSDWTYQRMFDQTQKGQRKRKIANKHIGRILTQALEDITQKKRKQFNPSFKEPGDEYADLLRSATATFESTIVAMLSVISGEPEFEVLKQIYFNATITLQIAQKMRDIQNSIGKGKAIAACRVGPSEVVSIDTQKAIKQTKNKNEIE